MHALVSEKPQIGIALSGGGSRAIAFHLGCLRTLNHLGVLQQARVISTVSGGSVIGAIWAAHVGDFSSFEDKIQKALKAGFVRPAIRTALTTWEGPKALLSLTSLALASALNLSLRAFLSLVQRIIGQNSSLSSTTTTWAPRRSASRTTILRHTLDKLLFSGLRLGDLPPNKPKLIVVSAELRTESAFYFTREEAGSWRIGKLDSRRMPLATAVAASAAYPLFLPALDEVLTFRKKDGSMRAERVTLTDGGVYDNLGLAPLWPDRDPENSVSIQQIDTIVACRAGYGLRFNNPSLFILARMQAVFSTISNRAQNASIKRLFDLKEAGSLKDFALPYLDQADERLAFAPGDLVSREEVADYPTDFSAMSQTWIDKLSKRGEQLTLAVIREHAPILLPDDWESRTARSPPTAITELSKTITDNNAGVTQ